MRLVIACFVVALSACARMTPEQRAERDLARYGPYCERLGFEGGTDAWRTCIVQSSNTADITAAQQSAAAAVNVSNVQRATQIQRPVPVRIVP